MLDNTPNLLLYIPGIFSYSSDSDDDTMSSSTSESRRNSSMTRRDSSRSSISGGRRPRLLRSSATAPSITPSTASRNGLAVPQDTRRATDLLNQFSSSPPSASSSPLSQSPSSIYEGPSMASLDGDLSSVSMDSCFRPHLESNGRYFSFPSFDTFEPDQSEQDREPEMKAP